MANENLKQNARDLEVEFNWLKECLKKRLSQLPQSVFDESLPQPPAPKNPDSIYASFLSYYRLTEQERLIALLALAPSVHPFLIERTLQEIGISANELPELGGQRGGLHGGLLPTGQTAAFLIAGSSIEARFNVLLLLSPQNKLLSHGLIELGDVSGAEPAWSGTLSVNPQLLTQLTLGTHFYPQFSASFPAKRIETPFHPDELVVHPATTKGLEELLTHAKFEDELSALGLNRSSPGCKCLFYGPPGTGKTMAAAVVARQLNLPLYRVDLSLVISKYIGETEKNIAAVFNQARSQKWILFFDEADALFGKRNTNQSSHDWFANQIVSYLLMMTDDYPGLTILATNFRQNIDPAFFRRFHTVVPFPMPREEERLKLWSRSLSSQLPLDDQVDIGRLAQQFQLSGANITNATRHATLRALNRTDRTIRHEDIFEGIQNELNKENIAQSDITS